MFGTYEFLHKRSDKFEQTGKFMDYAPGVFERIRKRYNISNEQYLRSIGPEQLLVLSQLLLFMKENIITANLSSLTELCSTGKSGSFFYFSSDGSFFIYFINTFRSNFFP